MYELEKLRLEIDELDEEIIRLLDKRMKLSIKVKEVKNKTSIAVLDNRREEEIKQKILSYHCSEIFKDKLLSIYQTIFVTSKQLQTDVE